MRTETRSTSDANLINAVPRGPEETASHKLRQRRIVGIGVFGWTVFVAFALWLLLKGDGGFSVWVFQERDFNQSELSERVQALFRGELGLQRTYPWILFGPFAALIAWYFPLERVRLQRNLPLNAVACVAFAWACQAVNLRTNETRPRFVMIDSDQWREEGTAPSEKIGVASSRGRHAPGGFAGSEGPVRWMAPGGFKHPPSPPHSPKFSLRSTILDLLVYGAIAGLVHSVNFYGRMRERERRALFLESNLANARLNTLKAQLQPHFLFNTLNAITALLRRDPRLAETTLVALSELLRLALSQSEKQEISLREELEFVQRYLEIQQTRFGDKLSVEQDIEPKAMDCMVPTLVLQPLVENAIRHGIEPSERAGLVRVSASRQEGKLVLVVEDNGVGLVSDTNSGGGARPPGAPSPSSLIGVIPNPGTGIGLANLRERLQALYGAQQKLDLKPRATGGVIVRVEIPWSQRQSPEIAVRSFQQEETERTEGRRSVPFVSSC